MKEGVTLRTSPRTVHLVRGPMLATWADGVTTWCGRRGKPYPPSVSSWRTCQRCVKARKEAET